MCRVPHREKMRTVESSTGPLRGTKESIPGKMVRVSLKPVVVGLRPFLKLFTAVSDQIIWRVLGRTYIYNVSWEDPRIDQREFMLTEDDHVITLASAGDNALDYVIEGAKVSAVDFNSCQIALCELKAAVVKNLTWEDTFAIFGRSDIARLRAHYHNSGLRDELSEKSQKFWDKRLRKDFNFMYSGTSGLAAWGLVHLVLPVLGLGFIRRLVMKGVSKEELDAEVLQRYSRIRFAALVIDCVLAPILHPLLGVPVSQAELGDGRDSFVQICGKVLLETDLVNDNYFYAGYLLGHYTENNCPRYLQKEHFETLKKNLKADKLTLFCGTMEEYVLSTPPGTFTVASLLDHLDWMTPEAVNNELGLLLQHMEPKRGRVFWRSFGMTVVSSTPSMVWLDPQPVDCHDDRVHCYFSTWIVHLKDTDYTMAKRCASWQGGAPRRSDLLGKARVGLQLVTYPVGKKLGFVQAPQVTIGNNSADKAHSEEMEAFYASQKEGYDLFREDLLPGRGCMVNLLPVAKGGEEGQKMIWVDVGGGTARNLEFFPLDTLRQHFSHIYIVDVSHSLLEMARARVDAAGLDDIVTIVHQDFTADDAVEKLCGAQRADLVTFSYSLSMIPKQAVALENASRLLKPNGAGTLAVADFFLRGSENDGVHGPWRAARRLEMKAQRLWFKQDGVHLLDDGTLAMVESRGTKVLDTRFRNGVPFLPWLRPYHGVMMVSTASDENDPKEVNGVALKE
ncbi:unnamed protein product [Ascophyllum nodosum]